MYEANWWGEKTASITECQSIQKEIVKKEEKYSYNNCSGATASSDGEIEEYNNKDDEVHEEADEADESDEVWSRSMFLCYSIN